MPDPEIQELAARIVKDYSERGFKLATAESCTGGAVATAITDISGASAVFERGFVTYSNLAKIECLGVPPEILDEFGAVSGETAEAMAVGALNASQASVALSVSGIAGPGGGMPEKPVGLVFMGIATRDGAIFHYRCLFNGDRASVRRQATIESLKLLASAM